jgi:8-oxo-dGTP diphosphatase
VSSPQVVVGAAVVRGGRVLAARRTAPASAAGRWEFPGGKVEPGESDADSLVRELEEELGVRVRVEHWLAGEQALPGGYLLRVAVATLLDGADGAAGDPEPHEHDELRWLGPDELDTVDWLDGDRPFLAELSALLPTL